MGVLSDTHISLPKTHRRQLSSSDRPSGGGRRMLSRHAARFGRRGQRLGRPCPLGHRFGSRGRRGARPRATAAPPSAARPAAHDTLPRVPQHGQATAASPAAGRRALGASGPDLNRDASWPGPVSTDCCAVSRKGR